MEEECFMLRLSTIERPIQRRVLRAAGARMRAWRDEDAVRGPWLGDALWF
jgi:hypothetical protein